MSSCYDNVVKASLLVGKMLQVAFSINNGVV